MNMTAQVPPFRNPGQDGSPLLGPTSTSPGPFAGLGDRLVQFGIALRSGNSTAGELEQLARACGIGLRLKLVEDGSRADEA